MSTLEDIQQSLIAVTGKRYSKKYLKQIMTELVNDGFVEKEK